MSSWPAEARLSDSRLENLDTLFGTLDDLKVDTYGVAGVESGKFFSRNPRLF
jgi:hypothetical protein